jgi:hypothetical protein
MDCAICYSEITKSTGKIELSCSHTFHIKCLTNWFKSQSEQYMEQSCPYCRHEANEEEEVPIVEKAEQNRFYNRLKLYEEEVTCWYTSASDQLNSYVKRINTLEDQRDTAMMLMDSYQKEADKYRLIVESARQAEIKNAKKASVANWAQWSATQRKV